MIGSNQSWWERTAKNRNTKWPRMIMVAFYFFVDNLNTMKESPEFVDLDS